MKSIRIYALLLAATVFAAACTKDNQNPSADMPDGRLTINAVAGSFGNDVAATKAHGEYRYDVVWDESDKIAVTDGSQSSEFVLTEGVGEPTGTFEQPESDTKVYSGEVAAYYPASMLQPDGSLVWPASQTWAGKLTGVPMTASATVSGGAAEFDFSNLGSVLQLVLTSTEGDLPLKSITLSADNAGFSGPFTISDGKATGFKADRTFTLDCNGLILGASAKMVYIPVPAATYTNMRLRFETTNGSECTLTSGEITFTRSVVAKVTLALGGFVSKYPDYLSFTARGSSVPVGIKRVYSRVKPDSIGFEYCLDLSEGKWTDFTADNTEDGVQPIVTIADGQTVFLRGKNERKAINKEDGHWIFDFGNASNRVVATGNIMSLLDPEVKSSTAGEYAFKSLFENAVQLVSAPELPAMTLGAGCYSHMFSGCTNLSEAPELPAAYLSDYCYEYMFSNTGLVRTAPMYASSLAYDCCKYMYEKCSSLVSARPLTATNLANSCYYYMFKECESLIEAPLLPSLSLAESCYLSMFYECKSLRIAPALPATEMAEYCYSGMFQYCTSLVVAPELPALTLATCCYDYMFDGCSSLVNAPELPATQLKSMCYFCMFKDCSSLVNAPYLPASTLADMCYMEMFTGCTSLKSVSVNFTKWDTNDRATYHWLNQVPSRGTFHSPSALAEKFGESYIPSGWTVLSDKTPSATGDLYWSNSIEGMYACDVTVNGNKKKLIIATSNLGANSMYDKGQSYSKAQLSALSIPAGWSIPTNDDMEALARLGFYDDFNDGCSCQIGDKWYYIPFTHSLDYGMSEARYWISDSNNDFYYFRSGSAHGAADLDTSSNYIRLVKYL